MHKRSCRVRTYTAPCCSVSTDSSRLVEALSDRYRIEREIGAGGMATVYLAHDLRHGRDVAIKVLHPDLGAALGGERFLSEIRTTAKLQHPHILPLLDSGGEGSDLYYVMPYVDGETLRARLEREQQLPLGDDVAPGDQRFIMIKDPPAPPIPPVMLVEHWFPELLDKVRP